MKNERNDERQSPETPMRVISVNVGQPREVEWKGRRVLTGIFKEPVAGPVALRARNLDGDRQADLTVHGGPDKAVYVYPREHYNYWRRELPKMDLPWGMFGENLTVEGLNEETTSIGDRFRIGSAEVIVTQPRMPCYKLGLKFGRDDILKRFLASERTGLYLRMLTEGEVAAGDTITLLSRDPAGVHVGDITRLYASERHNLDLLRRAIAVDALPASWRDYFQERVELLARSA
jgi:MOSC domain-containing protein YiiM